MNIVIVGFLQNTTIEYSSESVCVCWCIHVCVCVCVCGVCLHDNSKRNQSRNLKFENIVVYANISDMFGSRSRSRWDFEIFLHLPQ